MIRTSSHQQLSLSEFDWLFQSALDSHNRWVKMRQCLPCEKPGAEVHYGLPELNALGVNYCWGGGSC